MTPMQIFLIVAYLFLIGFYIKNWKAIMEIPKDIVTNWQLVRALAKNDMKSKFAGSVLGVVWAFVQPVVTVLVYWFVFEKAIGAATQSTKAGIDAPFVLWLVAGIVSWFFFADAVNFGTSSLISYNYLVKKVVFKIDVLPVVRMISCLFVHLFFIAFTLLMFLLYGRFPTVYWLQIPYYLICTFVLAMGIVYATSAVAVFFRDLLQVVNILLQLLIWGTPIMWNFYGMKNISPVMQAILKANPMFYIVNGYREALIGRTPFWADGELMAWFWFITLLIFGVGILIFRKLRMHFADVL
jgi:teichoic acid transport system permease protein